MNELQIELMGRVQGVSFRMLVARHCRGAGIRGYVVNRDDGSVFVCAQGTRVALQHLLTWLGARPGLSKVEGMQYHWKSSGKTYTSFDVIRARSFLRDQLASFRSLGKRLFGRSLSVPQHVAIIPDGNRRWAKRQGKQVHFGHYHAGSYAHMQSLLRGAQQAGVRCLSLWGFSTENWNRPVIERKAIFSLIEKSLPALEQDAHQYKIRFVHVGRKDRLPRSLVSGLKHIEGVTSSYTDFTIVLCLDYGGVDEVVRAARSLQKHKKTITESSLFGALDTAGLPPVDLVIRTSGEQRTSGFMPLQAAYAELYFSERYFPDFSAKDLSNALVEYGKRQRRFGK
ncbi:di-trans,poly-cis-decaprenylcistransferase [Candidatus Pacearchaeota archaeon]|nr:di-trans,poly-cis-decaprenylcistransferase [Candidatus Pacearchaeota archaeon]